MAEHPLAWARIPDGLWLRATELAGRYGVAKVAVALKLDYPSLKCRLAATAVGPSARLRVWVASEPADFRGGIDSFARRVRQTLAEDPFSGALFVIRNHRRTVVKLLVHDGRGSWLCPKCLSQGRFRFWPEASPGQVLAPHALAVPLSGGAAAGGLPPWRAIA